MKVAKLGADDNCDLPLLEDASGPRFPALLYLTTKTKWQRSIIPAPGLKFLYGSDDPPGWAAAQQYHIVDSDRRVFQISYVDDRYGFSDTGDRLSDCDLIGLMTGNIQGLRQSPEEFLAAAAGTSGDELFRLIYERAVELPQMSVVLHVAGCALILVLCLAALVVPIALSLWLFRK